MDRTYEIWDRATDRRVNTYCDMAQALAVISSTMNRLGEAGILIWALVRTSSTDEDTKVIATGKALAKIVREHARRRNS